MMVLMLLAYDVVILLLFVMLYNAIMLDLLCQMRLAKSQMWRFSNSEE